MAVKENLKTKDEKLESTLKDIEKMFGKGSVMKLGERPNVSYDIIHSGSLLIDNVSINNYKKNDKKQHIY